MVSNEIYERIVGVKNAIADGKFDDVIEIVQLQNHYDACYPLII